MANLNSKIGFIGVSKQTSKGTPVTPPTFGHGLRGGSVMTIGLDQPVEELTATDRIIPSVFRNGVAMAIPFTTRVYPRVAGLYYYGVMGGVADAGTSPNYTHTITPATTLPYLTAFARIDTEYAQVSDARVDELTLTWDGTAPPELSGNLMGATFLYGTSWTATNDESTTNILPTAGGTFSVDTGAAAATAPVAGGTITMKNNSQPVLLSTAITPNDIWPGQYECECTLKLLPADLTQWRKIITGTSGGTTVANNPTYGAFDITFTYDANTSLEFAATKVAFTADFPQVSAKGGPVELTIVGSVVKPSSGAAVTVTAKNSVATY
jgi:hypothetical protein